MWYVYFLRCSDNSIYTGITTDLESRVKRHNQGKGCKYTASRQPIKLIYSEKYPDKSQAARRESYLKGLTRIKKEEIVVGSLRPDSNQGSV
ncbi:MAG: GIY-YIG nuclease family protein [Planctomycetes bacterium]|nr:GIY-YIG nuclease family protein [Planctomycetota bacterium]